MIKKKLIAKCLVLAAKAKAAAPAVAAAQAAAAAVVVVVYHLHQKRRLQIIAQVEMKKIICRRLRPKSN